MMNNNEAIRMLKYIEGSSPDPSTKVACILCDEEGDMIAGGFNHMPNGCASFSWSNDPHEDILDTKYPYVIHAEMDAIFNSMNCKRVPYKAYVSYIPCNECTKALIQIGIKEIYYYKGKDDKRYNFDATLRMCHAAKIKLEFIEETV